jgi:hypothetical protein
MTLFGETENGEIEYDNLDIHIHLEPKALILVYRTQTTFLYSSKITM